MNRYDHVLKASHAFNILDSRGDTNFFGPCSPVLK